MTVTAAQPGTLSTQTVLFSRIKYNFDSPWICSLIQNVPGKDAQSQGPAQSFYLCCLTPALGWLRLGKRHLGQCEERFLCMDSAQGSAARPDSAGAVPALHKGLMAMVPWSLKPCFLGFPKTQLQEHCREYLATMPYMLGWTKLRQMVQPQTSSFLLSKREKYRHKSCSWHTLLKAPSQHCSSPGTVDPGQQSQGGQRWVTL